MRNLRVYRLYEKGLYELQEKYGVDNISGDFRLTDTGVCFDIVYDKSLKNGIDNPIIWKNCNDVEISYYQRDFSKCFTEEYKTIRNMIDTMKETMKDIKSETDKREPIRQKHKELVTQSNEFIYSRVYKYAQKALAELNIPIYPNYITPDDIFNAFCALWNSEHKVNEFINDIKKLGVEIAEISEQDTNSPAVDGPMRYFIFEKGDKIKNIMFGPYAVPFMYF